MAAYRAYDFLAAAESFRKIEAPAGRFASATPRHKSCVRKGYQSLRRSALNTAEQAPNTTRPSLRRRSRLRKQGGARKQAKREKPPPDEKTDEMRVDRKTKRDRKNVRVQAQDLTTPGAADAWIVRGANFAGDFLQAKIFNSSRRVLKLRGHNNDAHFYILVHAGDIRRVEYAGTTNPDTWSPQARRVLIQPRNRLGA